MRANSKINLIRGNFMNICLVHEEYPDETAFGRYSYVSKESCRRMC